MQSMRNYIRQATRPCPVTVCPGLVVLLSSIGLGRAQDGGWRVGLPRNGGARWVAAHLARVAFIQAGRHAHCGAHRLHVRGWLAVAALPGAVLGCPRCPPISTLTALLPQRPSHATRRYTPLKQIEGMPPALEYEPVRCKQPKCGAVLNPYWWV